MPRQSGGNNDVRVAIEDKTVTGAKKFKYIVAKNLSHVTGLGGAGGSVDGSLVDARVQRTFGIAALGNDEILTFESLSNAVRFISIPSNKVITLQTGFDGTQPAMTKDRTKVYAIGKNYPHKVFVYEKKNLWAPRILATQVPPATDLVFSACLDQTEQWLYFRDKKGVFGRIEIANPTNVEVIKANSAIVGTGDYNYMVYSPLEDCFYAGVQHANTIYKMDKAGNAVLFAGGNGLGRADGYRTDASFNGCAGMCIDSEGNLFIADASSYTIRKIDIKTGFVSTVAGQYGVKGYLSGDPLKSSFDFPYSVMADENDAIFIGESWGCTVRKLAIE